MKRPRPTVRTRLTALYAVLFGTSAALLLRSTSDAHPNGLVLTSLMVKLRCETFAERASIPAFIFFFQMLYPFAWVNEPRNTTAAAAGGCMLVRADALRNAGGIEEISNALIDDCALARALKKIGPVWLALTHRVRSIRSYPALADIRRMERLLGLAAVTTLSRRVRGGLRVPSAPGRSMSTPPHRTFVPLRGGKLRRQHHGADAADDHRHRTAQER